MSDDTDSDAVLCFVEGNWAYFTTQPLAEADGDDWDDEPWWANAGPPSEWHAVYDRDVPPWRIIKVAWDGALRRSEQFVSVDEINARRLVWLFTPPWCVGEPVVIPAGTTLREFCRLVDRAGGRVYFALEEAE